MASPERNRGRLALVSGETHPQLAQDIANYLETTLGPIDFKTFANSEEYVRYEESVRGSEVFVIQSHAAINGKSVNDSIFQQRLLIDAARRGSAKEITAVAPYLAYLRQDRKARGREPISAAVTMQDLVRTGADRLMSVEIHTQQAQGFISEPFDPLTARYVLTDWIKNWMQEKELTPSEVTVVSPDAGRAGLVQQFAHDLGVGLAVIDKRHSVEVANHVDIVAILGEVAGRHCVIIDDMIDTGGTLVKSGEAIKTEHAASVTAMATHAILSSPAYERLTDSAIDKVVVTDTLPTEHHKEALGDQLEVVSVAPPIAAAIKEVYEKGSVSNIFKGQNYS